MNENNGDMFSRAISEKEDAQRRERMNDVLGKAYEEQQALLADSENAERADREFAAKKRNFMRNLMGVIVKRSGGGPISPRLATWANGVLQKAGVKDGGIMAGGGFGKDGRFVIPTYGMDANGAQVPGQGIAYDGKSLFTMMNQLRGIFSDDDISRGAEFLRKSGVGEKEIASMSYNPFATMLSDRDRARREMMTRQPTDPDHIKNRMGGGAGGREVGVTATFKGRDTRPHGVHAFGSDGNGGITRSDWTPEDGNTEENLGTRDPKYQGRWKVISSGPRRIKDAYVDENGQRHEAEYENGKRYVNDKTGEEVFVRDGETPPWSNGGMSEKERIARMQDAGKTERANAKNATSLTRADIEARLKEMGFNLKKDQLDGLMKYRESQLGQGVSKDHAEAAAKELAAVRKSIESETDEKRKKELMARESQLQSVIDSFAGIGGGGSEKPVSDTERFLSGGNKGAAPAAAPKDQETPAVGKPKDGAGQASQTAVKKQEPENKQQTVSAPATQGAGEQKAEQPQQKEISQNADQQMKKLTYEELVEKYKDDPRGKAFKGESQQAHEDRLRRIDEGKTLADQMGRLFDKAKPEVKRTVSYMLKKLVKFANEPLISPETAEKVGSPLDPLHRR